MKSLLTVLVLVFLVAGSVSAQSPAINEMEGMENLEKVKRAKFRETYVDTGVDFSKYNKLYLGEALYDYRDVGPAKRTRMYTGSSRKSAFGISEADRRKFEEIVEQAFLKEIEKGKKFTIVETIDANTIILRGAVIDIISKVPPEFIGRSEIYMASVGEATLVMELIDATSGETLALVAERGTIGRNTSIDMFTTPTNSVTVIADVKLWAKRAASKLRSDLDSAIDE